MEQANFNVLEILCNVYGKVEKSKLSKEKLRKAQKEIDLLNEYLGTSSIQSVLFCVIFSLGYKRRGSVDLEDIAEYLETSELDIVRYKKDIDFLCEKCFVEVEESTRSRSKMPMASSIFSINPNLSDCIMNNQNLSSVNIKKTTLDRYDFVKSISDLIENRDDDDLPFTWLKRKLLLAEEKHCDLDFVKQTKKAISEPEDRLLFYEVCDDFIQTNRRASDVGITLKDIYGSIRLMLSAAHSLKDGKNQLIKDEFVSLTKGGLFEDSEIILTEKGKQLFLQEDIGLFVKTVSDKDLLKPENIKSKSLFYSAEVKNQIDFLQTNLQSEQLRNLRQRLDDMNMPKGVCALFYGTPGTGKTETALQIAKATNRAIMQVDISQTKSCWFGESEKKIKEIFDKYRQLCKDAEQTPILLFNEADAVLSKRKDVGTSNVAQTENAIQNIILQEMETLDGILIATTNLANNFDAAFERRFLFKVKFEKPTIEAKMRIWNDKLSWLTPDDSKRLAETFDFSGGEIDNIVRKATMDELITGKHSSIEQLISLCSNERLAKAERKKVGF
ncbi:MAG: ATP-binding protein [Paludibacteraceae bacterium]|nr:ATP-binding protein [Paludibacteraceae bacterium]